MKENLILCNLFTTLYPKSLYIEFILNTHAPRQSLFEMLNPGLRRGVQDCTAGTRKLSVLQGLWVTDSDLRLTFWHPHICAAKPDLKLLETPLVSLFLLSRNTAIYVMI